MTANETVVGTISSKSSGGWVDLPHGSGGVGLEVYDSGSEMKPEELVQQELEETLERVRAHTDARSDDHCGTTTEAF